MTGALFFESVLRASLLLGGVVAVTAMPSRAPTTRHAALLAGLAALVAMPLLTMVAPASPLAVPSLTATLAAASGAVAPGRTTIALGGPAPGPAPVLVPALLIAWAVGAVLLLGRALFGVVDVERLRRTALATGRSVPAGRRGARVVISPLVEIPAAVGFLLPAVLLPEDAMRWTPEERRAVLAHELAHLRRLDPWTLLLATVIRALHWPNPLAWIAHRRLRTASELACDRAAVATGVPADRYAELLVRLMRSNASGVRPALAPGIARPHGLCGRVRALLQDDTNVPAGRTRMATALVAIAALCLTPLPAEMGVATDWAERYGISRSMAALILRASAAEGIEPALAFGLVSVESGFDPDRVSRSGAVGLAQVLPSTAAALNPDSSEETLHDPETSLRLGLRLLGDYLGRFGGDRERALLAYHVGPTAVERSHRSLASVAPYPASVLRAAGTAPSRRTPAPEPLQQQ